MNSLNDEVILEWTQEATGEAAALGRRLKPRYPFFRPVTITIGRAQGATYSAFSRNIFGTGSLLHDMLPKTQQVILTIPRTAASPFEISIELKWCQPCGEGWCISRGCFRPLMIEELPGRLNLFHNNGSSAVTGDLKLNQ